MADIAALAISPMAWVVLSVIVVLLLLFSYGLVRYYSDPYEAQALPSLVITICLTLTLLSVFVIPLDIYSVSSISDPTTGVLIKTAEQIAELSSKVQTLYYALYITLFIFVFFLVPFAYFYYEEEDATVSMKLYGAFKYTACFLVVISILIVIGVVLRQGSVDSADDKLAWLSKLLNSQTQGDSLLAFLIGVLGSVGVVLWVIYTTIGVAHSPFEFLKSSGEGKSLYQQVASDLAVSRDEIRGLYAQHTMKGKPITGTAKRRLERLKRNEKSLTRRHARMLSDQNEKSRFALFMRPFTLVLGVVALLLTVALWVSMFISCLDRVMHSTCGFQCGFAISAPTFVNPLDQALTFLSNYFPADYLLLGSVALYIFLASLSAIVIVGVRFLWITLYTIRKQDSVPQALLMASSMMVFLALVLSTQLLALAPQYATFGTQVFAKADGTVVPCTLELSSSAPARPGHSPCVMSQLSTLLYRTNTNSPIFGLIFFVASWAFLAFVAFWFAISAIRKKGYLRNTNTQDSDDEYETF